MYRHAIKNEPIYQKPLKDMKYFLGSANHVFRGSVSNPIVLSEVLLSTLASMFLAGSISNRRGCK